MKNSTVKKILCLLSSAITALSLPMSAIAAELDSVPVIYVGEMSDNALYNNPNTNASEVVFDINSSDFLSGMTSILAGIALSQFADVKTGTTPVINGINSLMGNILCAPDGTSKSKTVGAWEYYDPISEHTADVIYTDNMKSLVKSCVGYASSDEIFFFGYDWRLDPTATADSLKDFIDHVENVTGRTEVSLLGVGFGGVVINSYLYEYEEHATENIASCVLYDCPLLGNAVIGDFMKGRTARVVADEDNIGDIIATINGADRGEAFMNFIEDDSTGLIAGIFENLLGYGATQTLFGRLFVTFISTIVKGEDGHQTLGKAYNNFALNADRVIYEDFLKEYLRNIPGLWALVPVKDYDDAMDFLFEDEFADSELLTKIEAYRAVIENTEATLKTAQQNGINVCIVANYGLQLLPATISLNDVSDGIESVKYSSAGALTTDNSTDKNMYERCINENHNHMSPDNDINAAYCFLPENTWFIMDLTHGNLSNGDVADFIAWLLKGPSQRFIRENTQYTQYMKYSVYSQKITPYTTLGDDYSKKAYGDIDLDGKVSATDARLALRISVNLETATKETKVIADVDGDGKVSASDARLILRYAVGLIQGFPV